MYDDSRPSKAKLASYENMDFHPGLSTRNLYQVHFDPISPRRSKEENEEEKEEEKEEEEEEEEEKNESSTKNTTATTASSSSSSSSSNSLWPDEDGGRTTSTRAPVANADSSLIATVSFYIRKKVRNAERSRVESLSTMRLKVVEHMDKATTSSAASSITHRVIEHDINAKKYHSAVFTKDGDLLVLFDNYVTRFESANGFARNEKCTVKIDGGSYRAHSLTPNFADPSQFGLVAGYNCRVYSLNEPYNLIYDMGLDRNGMYLDFSQDNKKILVGSSWCIFAIFDCASQTLTNFKHPGDTSADVLVKFLESPSPSSSSTSSTSPSSASKSYRFVTATIRDAPKDQAVIVWTYKDGGGGDQQPVILHKIGACHDYVYTATGADEYHQVKSEEKTFTAPMVWRYLFLTDTLVIAFLHFYYQVWPNHNENRSIAQLFDLEAGATVGDVALLPSPVTWYGGYSIIPHHRLDSEQNRKSTGLIELSVQEELIPSIEEFASNVRSLPRIKTTSSCYILGLPQKALSAQRVFAVAFGNTRIGLLLSSIFHVTELVVTFVPPFSPSELEAFKHRTRHYEFDKEHIKNIEEKMTFFGHLLKCDPFKFHLEAVKKRREESRKESEFEAQAQAELKKAAQEEFERRRKEESKCCVQ